MKRCPKCGHVRVHVYFKPKRDEDIDSWAHDRAGFPEGECLIYRCGRCGYRTYGPCKDAKEGK